MRTTILGLILFTVLSHNATAQQDSSDRTEGKISYKDQIEPIFRVNCQGCHQPANAQGDYQMLSHQALLSAGESELAAIVPGNPDESYLLEQITPIDGQAAMPKKGKPLSAADVALIREWIAQGAESDLPPTREKFTPDSPPVYERPPVITSIAYSPDGKWIAANGFQEVLLIDADSRETVGRLVGLSERVESISFSPDSSRLAVTGGSPGRLGEVQVWSVADRQLLLSRQITFDTVYGGCFSPNGKLIAFGAADNVVRAIDAETGEQVLRQGAHDDWILACAFNPDSTHLLSAGRDMTVKLTEVATERFVDNVTSITPGALRGGINALAMHPSRNEFVVGGADGVPKVFRIFRETERQIGDDANLIRQFPQATGRIFDVAVSHDGSRFAIASTLDGRSQIQVYPYDFDGQLTDELKAILKKRVAGRSQAEKDTIAKLRTSVSPALMELSVEASGVYSLDFSPDGQQVVLGGSDGLIRIVSVADSQVAHEFCPVEISDADSRSEGSDIPLKLASGMPIPADLLPSKEQETQLAPAASPLRLEVTPQVVSLNSPFDYCQLVVTAHFENGQTYDVTRLCQPDTASTVSISEMGIVRGREDGQANLNIQWRGVSAEIEVAVANHSNHLHLGFTLDVNPILSRLGCNAGTCHGAQKGKNGFKLSLRGYDPVEDIRALSDDLKSRRMNGAAPDASLMLLKPIGQVPHEGGVLLTSDSVYYETLRQWIADGASLEPDPEKRALQKVASIEIMPQSPVIEREGSWQQFRVLAHYPDGTSRDVTTEAFIESGNSEICKGYPDGRIQALRRGEAPLLVRYEGAYAAATVTVMGNRDGFVWQPPEVFNQIDLLVSEKWERMRIDPSQLTNDNEFLRRVRLDLTGLPPTVEELEAFLADRRPSVLKRMAKIEELLGSEDYVDHWTNKWADLLQVNSKFLGGDGAKAFRDWIRTQIGDNVPYDQFARSILTASGSNKENPAASYYKILRDPDLMMENTTHLFLAVRFNCNKCHDHPFERWTQDQYYELASYFGHTALKKDPESGDKRIGGTAVEGAKPLYEIVYDNPQGQVTHVRTGKTVEPSFPFDCSFEASEDATRRETLAAWITSPDNPYFAKSFVNRLWGYLTGTGLIEPLDDIRAGNPPTNPELMEHLTQEFIDSGFDVQHVIRLICNSRTYQLSVASNRWNADDQINYSHAKARRLPAEVLYDAVYHVTGAVSAIPGVAPGTRAAELPDVNVTLPDGFLNNLGRPVRESACECERSTDLQLGPIMALVSGPTVGKAISDPECALPKLANQDLDDQEMIRQIFLRILAREPSSEEVEGVLALADQIKVDHAQLESELAAKEDWWRGERAEREKQRLEQLASVKQAIVDRATEIAPAREQMEKERQTNLSKAKEEQADYRNQMNTVAADYLESHTENPNWFPLAPIQLSSSNKDQLAVQADRSIVASGNADKGIYTLTFQTPLSGITGLRLEALPQPGIKGGGPGLPENGNFVVTEIEVSAWEAGNREPQKVTLKHGVADFSQSGFDPKQVFDGKTNDQRGWAVSPRGGIVHWSSFGFAEPIQHAGDSVIQVKIHQFHNAAKHRLAHFRVSFTTDAGDVKLGLPEEFAVLQSLGDDQKSTESLADLIAYLERSDAKALELQAKVADLSKPIPEDTKITSLKARQKNLEIETSDDPALVQLRKDFAASQQQIANEKLTLAQDLTWALINSPAFLFNH